MTCTLVAVVTIRSTSAEVPAQQNVSEFDSEEEVHIFQRFKFVIQCKLILITVFLAFTYR